MSGHLDEQVLFRCNEEAAAWFARQRVAPLGGDDAFAFHAWLKSSPANARAWHRYKQLWDRLEEVRDAPAILALREAAAAHAGRSRMRQGLLRFAAILAVAAVMTLAPGEPRTPGVVLADSSSTLLLPTPQVPALPLVQDVSSRVGERALVVLVDGSKVTLNSGSSIHADLAGPERRITLVRGEAYFEVAKNAARPFVVAAGSRQVVAVGTAFNVRLEPQQLKVNLVEGKVRITHLAQHNGSGNEIDASAKQVSLEAGTSLLAVSDHPDRIEPLNQDRDISWRMGKLVFDSSRLGDVVAEVNRYSNDKIEIADPVVAERLVSGVFDAAGGLSFARALESYGLVKIDRRADHYIVLVRP